MNNLLTLQLPHEERGTDIQAFAPVADKFPGLTTVLDAQQNTLVWISESSQRKLVSNNGMLGFTFAQLEHLFYPQEVKKLDSKIKKLIRNNNVEETVSHFIRIREHGNETWNWYIGCARIFKWDEKGSPELILCNFFPMDTIHYVGAKAIRLQEEVEFRSKHRQEFESLTPRELEILRYFALSKSASEIAESLFISEMTVKTHRKHIKKKLNIGSYYELVQFARAFDLV
ncbi:response regulator transcription factor [Pedobacter sp. SYP-B3415]|uniref:response regulator transcription factor n=1 Tax=Pedobacter sp. SYP-B3415 TaxID=2496641 RepID=UPI00101CC0B5|nr:LuxR C-terminal-related transcriptional regulator [Pedobacter sp. SYP-B3415]